MTHRVTSWCVVVSLMLVSTPLAAQSVRGHVVDQTTEAPIVGASVLLLTDDGAVRMGTISGDSGQYVVQAPGPGIYKFRVDAPGYNTYNSPAFRVWEAQSVLMDMRMWSVAVLPAVTVTAEAEEREVGIIQGFYERQENGRGFFLTREDIEQQGSTRFTDLLRNRPGMRVVPLSGSTGYTVRFRGAGSARCPPMLWVDNVRWGPIDLGGGPDRELFPSELEAIEAYSPSQVPIEFSSRGSQCGVVAAWTKRSP